MGETLTVCDEDLSYPVRVVSPVFYDPDGEKLNG
jgi:glycine cleavage system aminomethyltransferase T